MCGRIAGTPARHLPAFVLLRVLVGTSTRSRSACAQTPAEQAEPVRASGGVSAFTLDPDGGSAYSGLDVSFRPALALHPLDQHSQLVIVAIQFVVHEIPLSYLVLSIGFFRGLLHFPWYGATQPPRGAVSRGGG